MHIDVALFGTGNDGRGQRMFTATLQTGSQLQQVTFIAVGNSGQGNQAWFPSGKGAGLGTVLVLLQ